MKDIVQRDAPILRDIAEEIDVRSITLPRIQKIIEEMKEALDSQDDGVAIAAPQIGYSLRMFVVSPKVPTLVKKSKKEKEAKKLKEISGPEEAVELEHHVFINPVIIKFSKETKVVEEGCLSVRFLYGEVKRRQKVMVEAYDEFGKKFTLGGAGLLAQIFQHEIDHLNGILFIDKAKYLEEVPPTKKRS